MRARTHDRVNASIPVHLDGGGGGVTRNLSPGGIFFVTDVEMKKGSSIHFTLEFDNPGGSLCLNCVGEIVRVEEADGHIGIAAQITESRMQRGKSVMAQAEGA